MTLPLQSPWSIKTSLKRTVPMTESLLEKKTCTTEIQLRNLLCPELPNLSPGGRGRVSLFSPPRANKVGPSWRPCHVIHTSNFFTHSTFFGTSLPLKLDFLLFLTRTCVEKLQQNKTNKGVQTITLLFPGPTFEAGARFSVPVI